MTSDAIVVPLGLLAAFLFALAAFFQQRAARQTDREGGTVIHGLYALMRKLVASRVWLTGWVVNLGGFATQAAALHLGSVAVVQPLLATQLMFAMPMSSLERRSWPRLRDWASCGGICGGLVVLLVVVAAEPLQGQPDRSKIIVAVLIALAVIAVVVPIAARSKHEVTNVATAACAGLCFSMTGVFLKLTSDDLADHGIAYTATDWVGYALAGSTLLGLVLEQAAFANGPLPWAIATKDSMNPIASYAIGVLAFPVAFPSGAGALIGIAFAGALLILGAIGLAHSPSAELWLQRKDDAPTAEVR